MDGLGLSYKNSGLDQDSKILQSTHLWPDLVKSCHKNCWILLKLCHKFSAKVCKK